MYDQDSLKAVRVLYYNAKAVADPGVYFGGGPFMTSAVVRVYKGV